MARNWLIVAVGTTAWLLAERHFIATGNAPAIVVTFVALAPWWLVCDRLLFRK